MSIAGIIRALLLLSSVEEWPAVASHGSITLEQIAQRTAVLALACSRCDKAGRFNLTTLIERHGPQFGVPALLGTLSANCPKRRSVSADDFCGIHCPDLPALFNLTRPP